MPVEILILAAGASSRMGGPDKLLLPVDGQPMLRRIADAALACGLPVTVTLADDRPARAAALQGLPVRTVTVASAAGMSASLRAGLQAGKATAAVMVVLADLPGLGAEDLQALLTAQALNPDAILRGATADGAPGHPVLFPPDLRDDLLTAKGDQGAQATLRAHAGRVHLVPLPGQRALQDIDTPEDWAAFRR